MKFKFNLQMKQLSQNTQVGKNVSSHTLKIIKGDHFSGEFHTFCFIISLIISK